MKINFYAILLLAYISAFNLQAQCNDVRLTSQADVDSFQSSGCTTLSGTLTISGADITNLNGLSSLTSVGMLFLLGNENLTNLTGLENLTTIGNSNCQCPYTGLAINDNNKLNNIDALSSVTTIGGMIRVGGNPMLQNIEGLRSVTSVGDNSDKFGGNSVELSSNRMLTSIEGLRGIKNNTGGIYITSNQALTNLHGLEGFTDLKGGGLYLAGNNSLTNINGLSNVQSIRGNLKIINNDALPNLNGLRSLHQMTGSETNIVNIEISENAILADVDSLSSFTTILNTTYRTLTVINNPNFAKGCGLYPIVHTYEFAYNFSGNGEDVSFSQIYIDGPCVPDDVGTCWGHITLSTQAQIDGFASEHGCTVIRGSLTITGPDITNLDGLSAITNIGYYLQIADNPLLSSVNGLGSLKEIKALGTGTAALRISNNPSLTNVDSLSSLTSLWGSSRQLEILNNPNLTKGCGLYPLVNAQFSCGNNCGGAVQQNYTGTPIGWQKIMADGPCESAPVSTCEGDITLSSQADVDAYPAAHGCSVITGNLTIEGRDIRNLNGLHQVTNVGGLLINSCLALTDVSGLSALQKINGQFFFVNDVSLTNTHGFESLTSVGSLVIRLQRDMDLGGFSGLRSINGDFELIANGINSLHGLENVDEITGQLMIRSDSSLADLGGLSGVKHIGKLWMFENYAIESMGLSSLESIGNVQIYNNKEFTNFDGMGSLNSIGDLDVFENPKLTNVNGLSMVTTVGGNVRFSENPMLTGLAGLAQMTRVAGALIITGNPALTDLGLGVEMVNGTVNISNNQNLENLNGLANLKTIGSACNCAFQGLMISDHPKLTAIDLSALTSLGGALVIRNNPLVSDLESFAGITRVGVNTDFGDQSIEISGNSSLTSLHGLRNISGDLRGGLLIYDNDALTTLEGLEKITDVGNNLSVSGNASLTNIDALSKIRSASYDVTISDNALLQNLNGLASLASLDGKTNSTLRISNNPMLTNVDSLSHFTNQSTPHRDLVVTNNSSLTKGCGLYPLIQNSFTNCVACAPTITISGNGPGVTEQEIRDGGPCEGEQPSTCSGSVNLSSQAEVDAFPSTYGCSVITGALNISGPDITNLDSLYQITTVKGNCDCPLRGLVINNNPNLLNIDGLSSLAIIDADAMVWIANNQVLTDLNGLSGLTSIGRNYVYGDYSINIDNNPALVTIGGFSNLTGVPGRVIIANNSALENLDGFGNISLIKGLEIQANNSLVNVNGLASLNTVVGGVVIENNPMLQSLDGLGSLVHVLGAPTATFMLNNNASLTNVDSLSSFTDIAGPDRRLIVTDNVNLTRGCGFYNLLNTSFCAGCPGQTTFTGNGAGVTKDEILAAGPCEGDNGSGEPTAPTNLAFADVTDNSMTVSYTAGEQADGYLTVMRAFESALPDEAPQDATEYNVGNVIGCCSIVVGKGLDTSLYIIYQEPDVDYYFDVIPYTLVSNMYNYFPDKALSGYQRTLPRPEPYPNPFVEDITIPFTVNEENTNVRIIISDQLGRPISEVTNDRFDRGKHHVRWNRIDMAGNRAGDGVYMYSISVEGNNPVKGMVVAK